MVTGESTPAVQIEDFATGERCLFACGWPIEVGQHVVVDGRRWAVVPGDEPLTGRTDRAPKRRR